VRLLGCGVRLGAADQGLQLSLFGQESETSAPSSV
jgi:hypothetical protein